MKASIKLQKYAACLLIAMLAACHLLPSRSAPEELIRLWVTRAPTYKDCEIEIKPHLIIFRNEAGYVSINYLKKIGKQKVAEKMLYSIFFEDKEGKESKIQVYRFDTDYGSILQFKHRDEEWIRTHTMLHTPPAERKEIPQAKSGQGQNSPLT